MIKKKKEKEKNLDLLAIFRCISPLMQTLKPVVCAGKERGGDLPEGITLRWYKFTRTVKTHIITGLAFPDHFRPKSFLVSLEVSPYSSY